MIVLRDPSATKEIEAGELRTLLDRRFAYLTEEEPYDPAVMAYFVVIEAGDAIAAITEQIGFDILRNRFDETRFDHPGFHRSFELLEEHRTCFEILFVLSDDGFGVDVFVPKHPGVDHDLLAMCAIFAVPAHEEIEP
jgi:hypothetical protein